MRWQTFMTIGMSCSTSRMVTPDAPIFWTSSMNRAVSDGFIPDTGSSSSSIDGFTASASATPSSRCSP